VTWPVQSVDAPVALSACRGGVWSRIATQHDEVQLRDDSSLVELLLVTVELADERDDEGGHDQQYDHGAPSERPRVWDDMVGPERLQRDPADEQDDHCPDKQPQPRRDQVRAEQREHSVDAKQREHGNDQQARHSAYALDLGPSGPEPTRKRQQTHPGNCHDYDGHDHAPDRSHVAPQCDHAHDDQHQHEHVERDP
jgi:hypothetical protein